MMVGEHSRGEFHTISQFEIRIFQQEAPMSLLLTRQDVEQLLPMSEAMAAVELAFREHALGNVLMPLRTSIRPPAHNGVNLGMPAYIGGALDALGLKVVSVYGENPAKYNLPTVIATVLLNDPRTGALLAVMDGTWLTAMRTGAVSGVATKYLARADARVATILGAGVQARTQLMAICEARQLQRAYVYDIDSERSRAYVEAMSAQLDLEIIPTTDLRSAIEAADILAAASNAHDPIFPGEWLHAGMHINGVGSHAPKMRELDTATIVRSLLIADQKMACLAEAGDIIIPIQEGAITEAHIHGELGQVITGQVAGRTSDEQITLFKSVGLAIQDVATAARIYALAKEQGVGQQLPL
jgi:alanine dehydrogenase